MTSGLTKFLIELMAIKRRKETVFFSEGSLLVFAISKFVLKAHS